MMKTVLENVTIILSLVFLAFMVLDYFNEKMNFLGSQPALAMLAMLCAVSLVNNILPEK